MKQAFFALAAIILLGITLTIQQDRPEFDRHDCIIQPEQVVINSYRGDDHIRSMSIAGNKVGHWQRGMKAPHYQIYKELGKDRLLTTASGEVPIKLFGDGQIILWGETISKDCYDAI